MPLPRSRSVVPVCVPSGTFTLPGRRASAPTISPPSASVVKFTGISQNRLIAVAPEELVLLHVDDDVQVPGGTAGRARFAFVLQPQLLAGGDARRES